MFISKFLKEENCSIKYSCVTGTPLYPCELIDLIRSIQRRLVWSVKT